MSILPKRCVWVCLGIWMAAVIRTSKSGGSISPSILDKGGSPYYIATVDVHFPKDTVFPVDGWMLMLTFKQPISSLYVSNL